VKIGGKQHSDGSVLPVVEQAVVAVQRLLRDGFSGIYRASSP
jgi:hypothetical protein